MNIIQRFVLQCCKLISLYYSLKFSIIFFHAFQGLICRSNKRNATEWNRTKSILSLLIQLFGIFFVNTFDTFTAFLRSFSAQKKSVDFFSRIFNVACRVHSYIEVATTNMTIGIDFLHSFYRPICHIIILWNVQFHFF